MSILTFLKTADMSTELQNIANELDTVSIAITNDYRKVGNAQCVLTLAEAKGDLLDAKKNLS